MKYTEENKAIEDLKKLKIGIEFLNNFLKSNGKYEDIDSTDIIAIDTALNLLEKQQKEIERRYEQIDKLLEIRKNSVPKEAIREKIEELIKELPLIGDCKKDCEKCFKQYRGSNFVYCYAFHQIKILKELLGE